MEFPVELLGLTALSDRTVCGQFGPNARFNSRFLLRVARMVGRKRPQLPQPRLILRPRIGVDARFQQLGHLGFRRKPFRLSQLGVGRDRLRPKVGNCPVRLAPAGDKSLFSPARSAQSGRRNETGIAAHHPRRRPSD
jgi:hypothetical protein